MIYCCHDVINDFVGDFETSKKYDRRWNIRNMSQIREIKLKPFIINLPDHILLIK